MECLARRPFQNLRFGRQTYYLQVWIRSWSSQRVRSSFIDFFRGHRHKYIPSSSVIPPKGDGTYFTNAGMNQFKPIILGSCDPTSRLWGVERAVNSQKCIRVGGKHNDLEDVGHDLTHHTFFEMLGNWSFGDYFKRDACSMAYQLLTEHYRLPADRLYFTYFAGDKQLNLAADEECLDIWASLGIPKDRILPFGVKDNFWDMGATGPCGPCTEIHFDHIGNRHAPSEVNSGSPSLVEIWNLVFMQYNRQADQSLESLPARHVDTGMGLERITAVLNGTQDNYATDLFQPIFSVIQQLSKCPAYSGQLNEMDTSYRILADHARMMTVSISDGLLPSNDNLGHKLRGMVNKCIQLSSSEFNVNPSVLLPALVRPVISSLGDVYPELRSNENRVVEVIRSAIDHYTKMLDQATRSFNKMISRESPSAHLSGETIASLERGGQYGSAMSLDFIDLLASKRGLRLDLIGYDYEKSIETQQTSKPVDCPPVMSVNTASVSNLVSHLVSNNVPVTDDSLKYSTLSLNDSHDGTTSKESVICHVQGLSHQGQVSQKLSTGSEGEVILDKTCFYAESGGQEADRGTLVSEGGDVVFEVTNVQRHGGYVIHSGHVIKGCLKIGDGMKPCISILQRQGNMRNHTGTHLLNSALLDVIPNTQQQGSNVTWNKMTFDFLTFSKFDTNDLHYVGSKVRECIQGQYALQTDVVPFADIANIPGVRFNANEEYPDQVRLVSILSEDGEVVISRELCGGTHVPDTSYLVDFCITQLGTRSQNVKRATCVTGTEAQQAHLNDLLVSSMCDLLRSLVITKATHEDLLQSFSTLLDKCDQVKQRLTERKLLLEECIDAFIGNGQTRVVHLIQDTEQAIALATALSECLSRVMSNPNQDLQLMSSLVKNINKALHLELLPKTCREEASACLKDTEHKVTEKVNAKNSWLILQQIGQAIDAQSNDVKGHCVIDVNPDINPRLLVKIVSRHSFQKSLILHQKGSSSHNFVIRVNSDQHECDSSPKDILFNTLKELQTIGNAKGKAATRKSDKAVVYNISVKGDNKMEKILSILKMS